jgi:hypothetical protein
VPVKHPAPSRQNSVISSSAEISFMLFLFIL